VPLACARSFAEAAGLKVKRAKEIEVMDEETVTNIIRQTACPWKERPSTVNAKNSSYCPFSSFQMG
jgi:hypothetical protein